MTLFIHDLINLSVGRNTLFFKQIRRLFVLIMKSTVKLYDVEKPKTSLSYWHIVILGMVPVVGLGVWYYYRNRQSCMKKDDAENKRQQNGLVSKPPVVEQSTHALLKQEEIPIKKVGHIE